MDYAGAYRELHAQRGGKYFRGYSIKPYVPEIAALVGKFREPRLLDYGSGKGQQYSGLRVHDEWGGFEPVCYDPGVPAFAKKPKGLFAGIICTDVLEHIEERDVPAVLSDIFGYAERRAFVFLAIACRPAKASKRLPDGRNVHLTVKPPDWWLERIKPHRRPWLTVRTAFDEG